MFTTHSYISRKNRKPVKVYEGGDDGSVLVWWKGFEGSRNLELAEAAFRGSR